MLLELKENRTHGTKHYPYEQYYMRNITHAFQVPVHWHEEIEIIYIEEGMLHVKIAEEEFEGQKDDIFFVNSRELHLMGSLDGKVRYYTALFPIEFVSFQTTDDLELDLFAPLRGNRLYFPHRLEDGEMKKKVLPILKHMIAQNQFDSKELKENADFTLLHMETAINLLKMMQLLYEGNLFKKTETIDSSNMQKDILTYIENHYTKKLTLAMLANQFHLSEKYMSHYFVEHFRLPFSNYVVHLRLVHAKQLLETTEEPVTEIALQSGFANLSYFIRTFKLSYGMPPLQYRKSLQ